MAPAVCLDSLMKLHVATGYHLTSGEQGVDRVVGPAQGIRRRSAGVTRNATTWFLVRVVMESSPPRKKLVWRRPLARNDTIPEIWEDSHGERPELSICYHLPDAREIAVYIGLADMPHTVPTPRSWPEGRVFTLPCRERRTQRLTGGNTVEFFSLRSQWVWASARRKAPGCRSRQAKRSACPT